MKYHPPSGFGHASTGVVSGQGSLVGAGTATVGSGDPPGSGVTVHGTHTVGGEGGGAGGAGGEGGGTGTGGEGSVMMVPPPPAGSSIGPCWHPPPPDQT